MQIKSVVSAERGLGGVGRLLAGRLTLAATLAGSALGLLGAAAGAETFDSLQVNGNSFFKGFVSAEGDFGASKIVTVNLSVAGGTSNLEGKVTIGGFIGDGTTLTVNATSTFNEPVTINSTLATTDKATLDSLEVVTNAEVKGNLKVDGKTTLNGTLDMKGNDITGVGTITAGTATVTTLNTTTIVNAGDVTTATLTTTGKATLDSVEVAKNADVKGNLTVAKDATVEGSLTVAKGATVSESFTVTPGSIVSMGGNRVQDVGDPIQDTDAVNKRYVDAGLAGINTKLASAFKEIDKNSQGIAIAMAMSGLVLPSGKNFALGASFGFFEDKQAIAVQGALRVNEVVTVTGGFGTGLQDTSTVGGRVGVQMAW